MITKTFTFKIRPKGDVKKNIDVHLIASTYTWNYITELANNRLRNNEEVTAGKRYRALTKMVPIEGFQDPYTDVEMYGMLTRAKRSKEFSWLENISSIMLQEVVTDAIIAYNKYFNFISMLPTKYINDELRGCRFVSKGSTRILFNFKTNRLYISGITHRNKSKTKLFKDRNAGMGKHNILHIQKIEHWNIK